MTTDGGEVERSNGGPESLKFKNKIWKYNNVR